MFTEVNPDKGTETPAEVKKSPLEMLKEFTEVNPDKGTETYMMMLYQEHQKKFTEVNPDKGTETLF